MSVELHRGMIQYVLKCMEKNMADAPVHLQGQDKEALGDHAKIRKGDVLGLINIVFHDGQYSELEKETMKWIRSNIGLTGGAENEWNRLYIERVKLATPSHTKSVRTTTINGDTLHYELIRHALKCVDTHLTGARRTLAQENYCRPGVGGSQCIETSHIADLFAIVFADGEYSELEKETMDWIRHHIGITKAARKEWLRLHTEMRNPKM